MTTMLLDDLLVRLNAAIDDRNRRIDAAVAGGRLTREVALTLKVRPGMATAEMILSDQWPQSFVDAVKVSHVKENSHTILELARFVKDPSPTIQQLCQVCGSLKQPQPVVVRTIDFAHLLARSAV